METKMRLNVKVGKEIRRIRKSLGMRPSEFVRAVNAIAPVDITITAKDFYKYERGLVSIPTYKWLKILAMEKGEMHVQV